MVRANRKGNQMTTEESAKQVMDAYRDFKAEGLKQVLTRHNWKFFAGIWVGFVIVWALSLLK